MKPGLGKSEIPGILPPSECKGAYTLLILVPAERFLVVGRLGSYTFRKGHYAYTGSALGKGASLQRRILRHLSKEKAKRWHIDYLLSEDNVTVTSVVAACTGKKMECEINRYLRDILQAEIPVPRFGASDCREKCGSHLLYLGEEKDIARRIFRLYLEKIGTEVTH
ncbi:MAG: GIY-YIG nuclease family protein, partial [Nitrososphaerota archaeon]